MIEYDKKKLGSYLRLARQKTALTQAEVASLLGYSSSQFVSNIERGVSVAPLKTLAKMIRVYKIGPEPLMKIIIDTQKQILYKKLK